MGGRGKSSGKSHGPIATKIGAPMNFGDPGAITLEQLEALAKPRVSSADVAKGIEAAIQQMLSAPPEVYARNQAAMARTLGEVARELEKRPAAERQAFRATLDPLLRRLRAHATEVPS